MNETKKWYAIYTRGRWEKKVAEQLTQNNIESYCPLNRVERQWSDRKKIVMEPLFTSYVFIYVSEKEFLPVRQTGGVINFVYWLGKPAIVRNEEIDIIKKFLNEHSNVKLEKMGVSTNDNVRILAGPLMSVAGKVIEVKNKTVTIQLPSMGYTMMAEIEKTNIELLNEKAPVYQMYGDNRRNNTYS